MPQWKDTRIKPTWNNYPYNGMGACHIKTKIFLTKQTLPYLLLRDTITGQQLLVDTGSPICLWPVPDDRRHRPDMAFQLEAAEGSTISAYGSVSKQIRLDNGTPFTVIFVYANVKSALLGTNFLKKKVPNWHG